MNKLGSVIGGMNMKLGSKFLNSVRITTQLLKSLQRVIVLDGATHTQKDGVKGNIGSLMKDGAEAFVLFLPGAKLVLRSSVLTVLDLVVDVMLENAENLGRCCLGKVDPQMAGSAAEVLQVSLRCPLPLLRTHPHSLVVCCFFVFAEMGATSTASRRLGKPIFV